MSRTPGVLTLGGLGALVAILVGLNQFSADPVSIVLWHTEMSTQVAGIQETQEKIVDWQSREKEKQIQEEYERLLRICMTEPGRNFESCANWARDEMRKRRGPP